MKKTFDFGKIAYGNSKRRINAVTIDVELRKRGGEETFTIDSKTKERIYTGKKTPKYLELSIVGNIWNAKKTDAVCCGQCLDDIKQYRRQLNNPKLFDIIYTLWKRYHLNGVNAGTPEQEEAIKQWIGSGHKYDYKAVCKMLKEKGLYEVYFTGKTVGREYNNELYKYGHGWVIEELPDEIVKMVTELINS